MPLHMTKVAYGCSDVGELRAWLERDASEARTSTRYLPKRHEEMIGSSLFWIHHHVLIGRTPLLGFTQREDGRWWIRMEPRLIMVQAIPRRAHQGWRYLTPEDAPLDLGGEAEAAEALPGRLISELAKLGLV